MGKKWANNVKKGLPGFQPTTPKPVSPGGKSSFFSRLFDKKENYEPLVPDGNYSLDDWGTGDGFQFDQMRAKIEERTGGSSVPYLPEDVTDEYRFGPHAVAHAKLDTKRREILEGLQRSESYTWTGKDGKPEVVEHNFNPSKIRASLDSLAYGVLEESGYFDRGSSKYRAVSGVYSKETIRSAERIYLAQGSEVFKDQRHSKEQTSLFPCEVTKTSGNVSYKYYTHPDVSELIHGVEKDQLNHGKLQGEISEHQGRVSARKAKEADPFNLSDW